MSNSFDCMITVDGIVWTPHNMTPAQAIDQLPFVCQVMLKKPPSQKMVLHLKHCYSETVAMNNPEIALLFARCLVKAEQMLAEQAAE